MSERYAIYLTLVEHSPLYQLAATWLQHDIYKRHCPESEHKALKDLNRARRYTAKASQYGFHATLKPPFTLKKGHSSGELIKAFRDFAKQQQSFECGPLILSELAGFIALVCAGNNDRLNALASNCVTTFESFRQSLTSHEIKKRRPETLSARQWQLLERWGYPYVMDEFRFHMTLTDTLPAEDMKRITPLLADYLNPYLNQPLMVNQISLLYQPNTASPFVVLETGALGAAS